MSRSRLLVLPLAFAALAVPACKSSRLPADHANTRASRVETLATPRHAPHAYGRAGDLVLSDGRNASLTFAKTADATGHRVLHGSIVDAESGEADPARRASLVARGLDREWTIAHFEIGARGHRSMRRWLRGRGSRRHGRRCNFVTLVCAADAGVFIAKTSARNLPAGATLADELNPTTSNVMVDGGPAVWEGARSSSFVALSEADQGFAIEAPGMTVARNLVHIAAESFPAPMQLRYAGAEVTRTMRVSDGDDFAVLATLNASTRILRAGLQGDDAAVATILSANGQMAARGRVGLERELHLPPGFGASLTLADGQAVNAGQISLDALDATHAPWTPSAPARATLALDYSEPETPDTPLPVHVLFRGLNGTPDPTPIASATHPTFAAGRSLYLIDGKADVALPPGRYRIVATHGFTYGIDAREITVAAGAVTRVDGLLSKIVDMSEWTAGDYHLHAAPSPDAPVPIDARVASLACEGVELAVATDHNVITDYSSNVARLGLSARIATIIGDEVTSSGAQKWGHFNAYPLPLPSPMTAPEDATPAYADISPTAIFRGARDAGARFVQINHPRMDPKIGYFDLTHFDARTGTADTNFSDAFDLVEAFNGVWIESPDRTRQGAHDVIGLVRRGHRVTVTGNSDSHKLLYEEPGYPRTFVHSAAMPIETRAARALDGLATGDTTVSSGPIVQMIVDGKPTGSIVSPTAAGSVKVHVRVRAPSWVPVEHVEIWLGDAIAQRFDVPPAAIGKEAKDGLRFETDLVIAVTQDSTLLAWADADSPIQDVLPYANARAIGFTGLTYVDVNHDGKIDLAAGDATKPR